MRLALRIVAYPGVLIVITVGILSLWVRMQVNFLRFGGEFMAYTAKVNPKTISEVYLMLSRANKSVQLEDEKTN